jgi:hypothetical protein
LTAERGRFMVAGVAGSAQVRKVPKSAMERCRGTRQDATQETRRNSHVGSYRFGLVPIRKLDLRLLMLEWKQTIYQVIFCPAPNSQKKKILYLV